MTATATASAASPSASGGTSGGKGRKIWPWVLLAVALVLVALIGGTPNKEGGRDYDPKSNGVYGTKALVTLLERYGAKVDISDVQPPRDADVAVMFRGDVPVDREAALRRWAAEGHTLIVADPTSELAAGPSQGDRFAGLFVSSKIERGTCTIDALVGAGSLVLGDDASTSAAARRFPVPPHADGCFTRVAEEGLQPDESEAGNATIVAVPEGKGTLVTVGAPAIFTNSLLAEGDNSVVAVDLMAPRQGSRVTFLQRPPGARVDPSLADLVSTGVTLGLLQIAGAFIVYLLFRGRRLGKPIMEPQPVQIPGSELVSAVGNLLQQTRSPDRAAAVLRADLRRRIGERLGLPSHADAEVLASSIEARSGIPRDETLPLLADLPCASEDELLALAAGIDDLRRRVLGGA